MACFEQLEKKMKNLKCLVVVVVVVCSFRWDSVDGSNSRMAGPSPPRDLRRSVVGVLGLREYHVYWTSSHDTGGSAVNYSVKLCLNDSLVKVNNPCRWSSASQCMLTNITSTSEKFSCILVKGKDFFGPTGEFANYTICVVASNHAGNAESCISSPVVKSGLATPRPPLDFSVYIDAERVTVRWKNRDVWQFHTTIFTVLYHAKNAEKQLNKTKEVTNKTGFTVLSSLKSFTTYCFYLMVQTLSRDGVRSAPSDVLGPKCVRTPAGGPSPPRDLRRSVVGVLGFREYHVYWTSSHDTGGSAVDYSVKLCLNDSLVKVNNPCRWSSASQCMLTNITSTSEKFSCILVKGKDFFGPTGEFANYTICVVASNHAGNAESCISSPEVKQGLATPRPPLDFSVYIDAERVTVRWKNRDGWQIHTTIFTVLYHAKNAEKQLNKTKEVTNKTEFTVLSSLKSFTTYCLYLMVQTLSRDWVRSAPSDVLGPKCVRTPAGDPDNPPTVEWDQSVIFPENAALRNVTVEWKRAKNSSWHGTPDQYHIYCNYHLLNRTRPPAAKKCEYQVDATSNRTVLQELNTADSYIVYIYMVNREGKQSGSGSPYTIGALPDSSTPQPTGKRKLTSTVIGLIIGAVFTGCVAASLFVFFLRKWRRENYDTARKSLDGILNQLDNPCGHDYTPMDSEVQHQYDYLPADVNTEEV